MSRFNTISPESATGKAKALLLAVNAKRGMVPNMMRAMANAPAVLEGYLNLSGSLAKGMLSPRVREQLALAIGQANQCDYCVAAHSAIGKTVGLTAELIHDSRQGSAVDSKTQALIHFALKLVETRGSVTDQDIEDIRGAGFDDGAIAKVVAQVAPNIFTNHFNRVAQMRRREASINDVPRAESERKFFWPAPGPRPAEHPGIPDVE